MGHRHAPPQSVLHAFNIHDPLEPMPGGRGLCFLAGDIILRPVDHRAETEWVSGMLLQLSKLEHADLNYRIARPLVTGHSSISPLPNQFISHGWSASSFVSGQPGPEEHWAQILTTSRAFHHDLKSLVPTPPAFLSLKTDRWAEADRVTWDEKRLEDVPDVNHSVLTLLRPSLARLVALKKPLPPDALESQLVHGDLTGNVLFEDDLAPAIIDLSPMWRPVEFAEAVVVSDGLTNHGQGVELIHLYGTDELRLQILLRALYWRLVTFAIQTDIPWMEMHFPGMDFEGAVELVCEAVKGAEAKG